jgi:hypothetical protein
MLYLRVISSSASNQSGSAESAIAVARQPNLMRALTDLIFQQEKRRRAHPAEASVCGISE